MRRTAAERELLLGISTTSPPAPLFLPLLPLMVRARPLFRQILALCMDSFQPVRFGNQSAALLQVHRPDIYAPLRRLAVLL